MITNFINKLFGREIYRITLDIDLEKNETRISKSFPPWLTLGLLLEATSFCARLARQEKNMSLEGVSNYCKDYFDKAIKDYKIA